MSIYDISLRYNLETFLDFHRLKNIMLQMWYRIEFLSPENPFLQTELGMFDVFSRFFIAS